MPGGSAVPAYALVGLRAVKHVPAEGAGRQPNKQHHVYYWVACDAHITCLFHLRDGICYTDPASSLCRHGRVARNPSGDSILAFWSAGGRIPGFCWA
jgi:hypothetical protein